MRTESSTPGVAALPARHVRAAEAESPVSGVWVQAGTGSMAPTPAGTDIRSAESVLTLLDACGDHRKTHLMCQAAGTYEELAALPLGERAGRLGAWSVPLQLPPRPQMQKMMLGVGHITRYDPRYPEALVLLEDPPALIQQAGALPGGPSVTIGGTRHPGTSGREAAAAAARAAWELGARVVAVVDGGCGQAALQQAASSQTVTVAVTPYRLDRPGVDDLLVGQVLAAGGAVVSVLAADGEDIEARMRRASQVAAALSPVVVLAELGVYAGGGGTLVRTAVSLGRYLVVPAPQQNRCVPLEATGVEVLARARRFSPEWFGTSSSIDRRISQGRPAADAVVSTYPELLDALRWGLGVPAR